MNTSIEIANRTLRIRSLDVSDDVTVGYVDQLEPEAREAGVMNCLQLGARTLTFASGRNGAELFAENIKHSTERTESLLNQVSKTAEQSVARSAETVQKAVEKLLEDLAKNLGDKLDPANTGSVIGNLRTALADDYQKMIGKVRQDLDFTNPASPLSALRAELERGEERRYEALRSQLADLVQAQAARSAGAAERAKSTRKGVDFESVTEEVLVMESRPRKDLVRRTTTEPGLDQNLTGDFVVQINPNEGRGAQIVIECKNGHNTAAALVRELERAMKNRGAAFGIAVVTDWTAVSDSIIPYGDDMLLVRVPPTPDGDGWDFLALSVALEGARWKAIMARGVDGSLDINQINAQIERAVVIANRFTQAKARLTTSKNQLDGVTQCLDDMHRDLIAALQRIREAVTRPPDLQAA